MNSSVKRIRPKAIAYNAALANASGDKRMEILRQVGVCGSISQAAREAGVSYKAAWQAIDTLSNLAGVALVDSAVGGSGGGGARLTAAGAQLLEVAGELAHARNGVLARVATGIAGTGAGVNAAGVAALGLRTSMRNQLPCAVQSLEAQGPVVRVRLVLPDGNALVSRITQESAELLGLREGLAVLALCKATAASVVRGPVAGAVEGRRPKAQQNLLAGRASRVTRGELGDEVGVQLEGGLQLVGFAKPASGLRSGSRVVIALDESAVVIALAS